MPLDIRKPKENTVAIKPIKVRCNQETPSDFLNKSGFQVVGEKGEKVLLVMSPMTYTHWKKTAKRGIRNVAQKIYVQ